MAEGEERGVNKEILLRDRKAVGLIGLRKRKRVKLSSKNKMKEGY